MMEVKGMADVPGVRAIYVNSCAPSDKKSYVCVCANLGKSCDNLLSRRTAEKAINKEHAGLRSSTSESRAIQGHSHCKADS
jgi:hypothetical protein